MQGKAGWTLPGTKRSEYIESLKPAKLKAKPKEPKMNGFVMYEDTAGQQCTAPYIIQNQQFNNEIQLTGSNLYWPPTTVSPYIGTYTGATASSTSNNIIYQPYTFPTASASITTAGTGDCSIRLVDGGTGTPIQVSNWGYGLPQQFIFPSDTNLKNINAWPPPPSAQEIAKQKWRQQLIIVKPGRGDYPANFGEISKPEATALMMLKGMLSEQEWRRYLKDGFIVVRGRTGLRYQIIRGQSHVKVYRRGEKVAELCIGVKYDLKCPPTDGVIARKIMVECDELSIWHGANIHQSKRWGYQYKPTERELIQLAAA